MDIFSSIAYYLDPFPPLMALKNKKQYYSESGLNQIYTWVYI
jgi:hypothetical protein